MVVFLEEDNETKGIPLPKKVSDEQSSNNLSLEERRQSKAQCNHKRFWQTPLRVDDRFHSREDGSKWGNLETGSKNKRS